MKRILLFLFILLLVVVVKSQELKAPPLVKEITGMRTILYVNGEKVQGDYIPITDGRTANIDFTNDIITFKHVDSPFKIISYQKSEERFVEGVYCYDIVLEVVDKNKQHATIQLVLFGEGGILGLNKKGRITHFYLNAVR